MRRKMMARKFGMWIWRKPSRSSVSVLPGPFVPPNNVSYARLRWKRVCGPLCGRHSMTPGGVFLFGSVVTPPTQPLGGFKDLPELLLDNFSPLALFAVAFAFVAEKLFGGKFVWGDFRLCGTLAVSPQLSGGWGGLSLWMPDDSWYLSPGLYGLCPLRNVMLQHHDYIYVSRQQMIVR